MIRRWAGIILLAIPIHAQSIIVTGTWTPMPAEEAERALCVLPVDEKMLLLSTSWNDLLGLDPSLDVQQRAPNGALTDLSIRGGSFGQTLVLLNGLRINDPQTGHFNMNVPVPMEAAERIEVLRGAGSIFYGSDAVGGVINVITAAPEINVVRLRTAFGSFGTQQQRARLDWSRRFWSQRLVGSREFSTGFLPNRDYRNLAASSQSEVHTRLGNTSLLLAYADRPFGAERFYGDYPSWERTKTWWLSARQTLGSHTEAAFAFRRNSDLFVLYRYDPQRYTNRHISETYQASVRRTDSVGSTFQLHYGLEGFRDNLNSTNLGQRTRDRGAGYFGVDARVLKRFSFTAGGREEFYTAGGRQFSPTAAGAYWPSQHAKLRASVSHAFRLPTFTDLYYQDPANIGNPLLRPERAWSYEAGLDWNAGPVRGELTVFERKESDGIDYVRRSTTDVWRAMNFNQLSFQGAEIGLAWLRRRQRFDVHHTFLGGTQDVLSGLQSKYVFNYPSQSTVAGWQGELPKNLIGRVRLGRIDRVQRDTYTVVDLYLARPGRRLVPFMQLTNITNTRYEVIPAVPNPGRAAVIGIELRISP